MAFRKTELGLALVLVTMLLVRARGQSSCTSTLMSLAPCLNYVTGNSSTPSSSCCSQLSKVVQSSPQCLCLLLNGSGATLGITINQTRALSLPGACNVETPPVSRCQSANGPTTSPADSNNQTPAEALQSHLQPQTIQQQEPQTFQQEGLKQFHQQTAAHPTSEAVVTSKLPFALFSSCSFSLYHVLHVSTSFEP